MRSAALAPLCGGVRRCCLNTHTYTHRGARQLTMVNVKKRKGRVVIDSDSEDSASDDNLDQVGISCMRD